MTGIFIIARLGSTRLKKKHLIEAAGKSFLEWMILRIQEQFQDQLKNNELEIVIVTSDETENRELESYASKLNCRIFYGNVRNIPLRQLECAKELNFKNIISVDGDDILCSSAAMMKVYNLLQHNADEIIKTSGLPLGMNIMGYPMQVLEKSLSEKGTSAVLETGWGSIFEDADSIVYHYSIPHPKIEALRMTLDYEPDADFFRKVIEHVGNDIVSIRDEALIQLIIDNQYSQINSSLSEEYWNNFNSEKQNTK